MVECRHPETMFGSRGHGMLIGDWGNRHGALGQRLVGWCSRNRSHAARCWSGRRRRARPSGVHLRDDAGGWCGGMGEVARGENPGGGPLVAAGDVQAARSAGGTYKRRGVGDEGAMAARGAGTSVDGDAARGAGAGARAPGLRSTGGT